MSSIVASVCIQTMSLHDSTASLLNLDDRQGTKSLRVNLSGVQIQPSASAHVKLLRLDARRANEIGDLLEECIFWRGDILVTVTNFPDEISSAGFTSELVESIYCVFRWMQDCFNIIINCMHGRNRCVSFAARLASRIQDGINEPSKRAYHFYRQICQSVCEEEYEAGDHNTWPHLCTNHFAQSVIYLFPRREGVLRYPRTFQGIRVENPRGSLRCNYEYNPEQLENDIAPTKRKTTSRKTATPKKKASSTKKPISRQSQRRHEQTAAKNSVFTMKEAAPKKNTALESKAAAQ
jgi:hypothetical protein